MKFHQIALEYNLLVLHNLHSPLELLFLIILVPNLLQELQKNLAITIYGDLLFPFLAFLVLYKYVSYSLFILMIVHNITSQ